MAGATTTVMNDTQRFASRPIPKRGQVKVGIVVGLAHSFAALFSQSNRRAGGGGAADDHLLHPSSRSHHF
uniref:Uncharacterized protein n=1 Tax=Nelumbo nucifera TaxID=4432 RepID=A0A822XP36_NELNU|nr:TPA_asm: hypothetical protein HUJ06_022292 [Nelumbo nucifera]